MHKKHSGKKHNHCLCAIAGAVQKTSYRLDYQILHQYSVMMCGKVKKIFQSFVAT